MDTVIAMPRVSGSKGFGKSSSGSSGSHEDPNTLRSNVRARIIDLWGEGVFEGFVSDDLRKDVFFDRTPVMNADGTLNFPGVTIDYRLGLADQEELKGFPMVEAPYSVGARVYKNQGPIVRTISDRDATSVRVIVTIPALHYTNKTEKFAGLYKASVNYAFDVKTATGDWVEAINTTINDKCTSPYQRAHRVDLPAGGYPWQVRMRRISPDSTDDALQDQTVWDSYVEVVEARLTYMHSAVAALEVDARQFGSSVPNRSYRVRGRKWEVPSNYDPITRTYTGLWDGSWVEKWTNNPAYVFRGLALQDRFGLGEFVDRAKIDDAGIYQIGQYCDQGVDDGFGRLVPRYTFNGVLNTFKEAHKAMQDIAATFRGMSFWTLGQIFAVADMPKDPVLLVTKANTIGGFEYSSTAMKARHTAASVAWNDPEDFYKPGLELYRDPDGVRQFGWRQADVQLEGCTVRAQAYRMGAWLVDTELNEFETVTYRASFDHAAIDRADVVTGLLPGDIIQIADPRKMRVRAGGRVVAAASTTRVQLDAPFPMVAGQTYKLRVTRPNGKIAEASIASIDANNVAVLNAPLPELPLEEAVWVISGTDAAPRQYRVLEVAEEAKNVFRVTGLFYDPTKYDRVEKGIKLPTIAYTRPRTQIAPPTNLAVRESQYFRDGQPRTRLTLSWTPGNDFMSAGYLITAQTPAGFQSYGETGAPTIDIDDAQPGDWVFTVVGRSNTPGVFSPPEDFAYVAKGWAGTAGPTISNLRVQGGGTVFSGRDASLLWDVTWPADAQAYDIDFVVRVLDAGTDQVVRVASTASPNWSYTFETNANDGRAGGLPGPRRAFKVRVSARDLLGRETAPVTVTVSNPAPEIIVPTLGSTSEVLFVDLPKVADADFAGYLIWVSETPNINPLTAPSYDITGNSFPYRGVPDKTYYVRAAAYDAFSKDPAQLNVSAEQSKKLTIQLFDPLAPPIPGTPTLASNVAEIAPDGAVTAKVTIQWPAVTSTNFATYEVAIAEGNNPAQATYVGGRFVSGTTAAFAGLMPGRQYSFKVRSNPLNGFADSGWSPILVVTAALNTTPPAAPTGFMVDPSFEAANLAWTNPTNKDLLGVEVWAGTTNVLANAALLKTVPSPAAFYRDVIGTTATKFYWIRSVNTSDFKSGYVGPLSATSVALAAAQIQAGIIDATKLADSIAANTVVAALPTAKTTDYVTLGGEQYRWDATAVRYTKAVAAADISGQIDNANIAAGLDAAKIAGQLTQATMDLARIVGTVNGKITGTQITDQAITTPLIAAEAVKSGNIAAGAVTTSKLAVVSANIAYNPDASQGTRGWSAGGSLSVPLGVQIQPSGWAPNGYKALYINATDTASAASGKFFDLVNTSSGVDGAAADYPVTAGSVYEFSACISAHRCTGTLWVCWRDAAKAVIAYSTANGVVNQQANGGIYADFPKSKIIVTAPAGAVSCFVFFRMDAVSGDQPYLFVSAFMLASTKAGATETSPYVAPGITTIDGSGIITRSLSANKLVANSITAGEIAARTITAGNIVTGTLTGNEIQANSVNADRLVANSITTAQIAAGAIRADQIAAGAITASKLAIVGANMAFNADFAQGLRGWYRWDGAGGVDAGALSAVTLDANWNPSGLKNAYVTYNKTLAQTSSGQSFGLMSRNVDVNGSIVDYTVIAGNRYEFSAYVSSQRCQGIIYVDFYKSDGSYAGNAQSSPVIGGGGVGGSLQEYPRMKLLATAPAGSTKCLVYFMAQNFNGDYPYIFVSGFMMASTTLAATETSPYEAPSATLIDGGILFTNSLHANRITAGTITADRIAAGSITVDRINAEELRVRIINTDGIQAGSVIVGSNRLSNWVSTSDTTRINGGAIAANSIDASRLNISSRPMQVYGLSFEMQRDGNGVATGWLIWTSGYISYINASGTADTYFINAGSIYTGFEQTQIWWHFGWDTLSGQRNVGIPAAIGSDRVPMCSYSYGMGINVNHGGTVIDGSRITTRSIQAVNIAAAAIQTDHMAANSISGDRIQAGTLSADKITTGTLTVNASFSLGSLGQTDLYAFPEGGVLRVRNRALNQWRGAFGYIGAWTGDGDDFGLMLWGADGVNRVRFSNAVNFIDGVVISDATIQNAKIANLTIGNEKVQSEAITRGAFATTGAGGADTSVGLTIRNPGTRVVIWVARTGAAGQRYLTGAVTGQLQIYWARPGQGWELIRAIPNAFMYEYVNGQGNYLQHLPTSDMCQVGTLEGGYYQFRVLDTSAAGASSVSICAVEFSK